LKVTLISDNQESLTATLQQLHDAAPECRVTSLVTDVEHLASVADQEHTDVLVLDQTLCRIAGQGFLEQFSLRHPETAVMLLCEAPSPEFIIDAMRAGAREVLSTPLVPVQVRTALNHIEQRLRPLESAARPKGKVIAFIACKGGSGATFLATNLGYCLALHNEVRVALLDLNLQFGDAALFVSDQPVFNTLAEVADSIDRLDASLLDASMLHVLPNYGLLPAPEDAERALGVKPERIEAILELAREHYDYVILDVGRSLNAATLKALDSADYIYPVMQETLPFIRDAKRLVGTLLALGLSREKIRLVVNRHTEHGGISLQDVEDTLGMKTYMTVPNSYDAVSSSVNQGIPVCELSKHDPVTRALERMSELLMEVPHEKRSGWLSNIFHAK
jgi:pilus assembly protein CpaE